ncbi:hypothetical protein HMPREF1981_02225 [Bacteroides pyogenes F0041]|uniref:Uncharacterized protein n=1 Tax=Bacteroides pyogenes F0041 TaxID=1321819 RepID=U2C2T4_9BACE|nr:hypothetical protein HMPREF1981_02225 [Bacteroides pyogenes F0041]GAE22386.1 hypothetical protein JCM10003_1975 [Bacteroides pyogenes JCM 10003]
MLSSTSPNVSGLSGDIKDETVLFYNYFLSFEIIFLSKKLCFLDFYNLICGTKTC